MGAFADNVKMAKLTKAGRLIAEYCLQNQHAVPFQSLVDIAKQVGVSDVSVIRFARSLGYEGFIDLKQDLQMEFCQQIEADPNRINPVAKYVTRKDLKQDAYNFMIDNANMIYKGMVDEIFTRTWRSAVTVMTTLLRMILRDVIEIDEEGYHAFQKTLDFTPEDCLFFYTFGRFSPFEKLLLDKAKESGVYLIVATDLRASPAAQAADLLLYSSGNANLPFFSSVGNVILAESLFNIIAERDWEACRDRIQKSETYLNEMVSFSSDAVSRRGRKVGKSAKKNPIET